MSDGFPDVAPEFSRVITAARLPPHGIEESYEAKPDERAALAKRFELLRLDSLKAELSVKPGRLDIVTVTGKITATFVQNCVVTLEPLTTRMKLDIDVTFVPAGQAGGNKQSKAQEADEDLDDAPDEDIETYSKDRIDLGEMVAQQMAVNIDPYPRKPDAALPATEFGSKVVKMPGLGGLRDALKNKDKTKD